MVVVKQPQKSQYLVDFYFCKSFCFVLVLFCKSLHLVLLLNIALTSEAASLPCHFNRRAMLCHASENHWAGSCILVWLVVLLGNFRISGGDVPLEPAGLSQRVFTSSLNICHKTHRTQCAAKTCCFQSQLLRHFLLCVSFTRFVTAKTVPGKYNTSGNFLWYCVNNFCLI